MLNNPLRFVDPTGESSDDDEEPQKLVERKVILDYQVNVQSTAVTNATIQVDIHEEYYQTVAISESGGEQVVSTSESKVTAEANAVVSGDISDAQTQALKGELATVRGVAQDIVEISRSKGVDPAISLAISAEETHLGIGVPDPANRGNPAKASDVNPMQLSGSRETMDRKHNIAGAVDDYIAKSRGGRRSFEDTMNLYGGNKYPHATKVASDNLAAIRASTVEKHKDRVLTRGFE